MRKYLFIILFITLALKVTAESGDDFVKKMMKARGVENYNKIKTWKIVGRMQSMGVELPFTYYYRIPYYYRLEASYNKQKAIQTYNGREGWLYSSEKNKTEKLPEELIEQLKEQAKALQGPLIDYKEKGINVELKGKAKLDGKEVIKLRLSTKDKQEAEMFVDPKTYQVIRTVAKAKQQGKEIEITMNYKNYKTIKGVVVPHLIETKAGNMVNNLFFDKVEGGLEIKDSMFKKPGK
ncbi:MAG: hypothetical protein HW421_2417 [Ignavibacteria bacterium]|nr:hypothetical protein [Ignavibacteria bacterium]